MHDLVEKLSVGYWKGNSYKCLCNKVSCRNKTIHAFYIRSFPLCVKSFLCMLLWNDTKSDRCVHVLQAWVTVSVFAGWTQQKMRSMCGQVWFRAPTAGWTLVFPSEPTYSSALTDLCLTHSMNIHHMTLNVLTIELSMAFTKWLLLFTWEFRVSHTQKTVFCL